MSERSFSVTLRRQEGMEFLVDFGPDQAEEMRVDETPPLGEGNGPDAVRLLAAAVGQCLSSSLLFCLAKARVPVQGLQTVVEGRIERNEQGRLRVAGLRVRLEPGIMGDTAGLDRCLDIFENFCTVAESVRRGIEIDVEVDAAAAAAA